MEDYEGDFNYRNKDRRNAAEDIFEEKLKKDKIWFHRLGFNQTENNIPRGTMFRVPDLVRNIPDYIILGKLGFCFAEVKGGTDNFKFKLKNLASYDFWNEFTSMRLLFFLCSPRTRWYCYIWHNDLRSLIAEKNYKIMEYDDNKAKFIQIPIEDFENVESKRQNSRQEDRN